MVGRGAARRTDKPFFAFSPLLGGRTQSQQLTVRLLRPFPSPCAPLPVAADARANFRFAPPHRPRRPAAAQTIMAKPAAKKPAAVKKVHARPRPKATPTQWRAGAASAPGGHGASLRACPLFLQARPHVSHASHKRPLSRSQIAKKPAAKKAAPKKPAAKKAAPKKAAAKKPAAKKK